MRFMTQYLYISIFQYYRMRVYRNIYEADEALTFKVSTITIEVGTS